MSSASEIAYVSGHTEAVTAIIEQLRNGADNDTITARLDELHPGWSEPLNIPNDDAEWRRTGFKSAVEVSFTIIDNMTREGALEALEEALNDEDEDE